MEEPYNWEQAMDTTKRSAMSASQNSERAVAGMAKLLHEIDRHSNKIARLTTTVEELQVVQPPQGQSSQAPAQTSRRASLLGLLSIFAAGLVFGGFIMS